MSNPIDERIGRFEYYMRHRVIRVAEILARHFDSANGELSESGFFILSGVSSYFETINQFLTGEDSDGQSKAFFVAGFKNVYHSSPLHETDIKSLYQIVRCGMYHSGMPKGYTVLDRNEVQAIRKQPDQIVVNPAQLVRDIKNHFEKYIAALKDLTNATLRDKFNKRAEEMESSITVAVAVPLTTTSATGRTTPPPMMSGQKLPTTWPTEQ